MLEYVKVVRDAVHGDLYFTALEVAVMNTAPFQRLRGLKQLGVADLVYPSATHTRFNHLLGTCGVARRMIRAINTRDGRQRISEDHEELICLGAMLHDILNLPFGHTIEDEFPIFPANHQKHDGFDALKNFLEDDSGPIAKVVNSYDRKAPEKLARLIAAKEPMPGKQLPAGAVQPSSLASWLMVQTSSATLYVPTCLTISLAT